MRGFLCGIRLCLNFSVGECLIGDDVRTYCIRWVFFISHIFCGGEFFFFGQRVGRETWGYTKKIYFWDSWY